MRWLRRWSAGRRRRRHDWQRVNRQRARLLDRLQLASDRNDWRGARQCARYMVALDRDDQDHNMLGTSSAILSRCEIELRRRSA